MAHVLFVVWEDPLITIGQNTFIADALRWAGAESIVLSDQNWPHLSFEEVVRLQPDYIVFTASHGGAGGSRAGGFARAACVARSRRRRAGPRGGRRARRPLGLRPDWSTRSSSSRANCIPRLFGRGRNSKYEIRSTARIQSRGRIRIGVQFVRPLTLAPRVPRSASGSRPGAVCGGGDFAAHGRVPDRRARHRDDARPTARWAAGTRFPPNSGSWYSACGCRASRWEFWWARRWPHQARVFRRCCAIRWPIPYVLGVSSGAALGAISA